MLGNDETPDLSVAIPSGVPDSYDPFALRADESLCPDCWTTYYGKECSCHRD